MRRPSVRALRVAPPLARHVAASMPWITLVAGCLVGLAFLALLAHVAGPSDRPLGQSTVRVAFLPVVAALAFVLRAPFRPLTQTTPVPAWVTPAGHLLLAAPVIAAAGWAQLLIAAHTIPPHVIGHPPAVYPLIAQLAGWCAVAVAAAACTDRSRYADLGGGVAAPVTFAAIAIGWYLPATAKLLVDPPATTHGVAIAWSVVVAAALAVTALALRDQWHRYSRRRARASSSEGADAVGGT